MLPLELVINSVTDPLDKVDEFTPPDLQLPGPAEKASLIDEGYLDIDDVLSSTRNSGVKSALSQSIPSNDLKLSHTEDNMLGYSGQATSCASTGQSEELFEDIHHSSELGGINHGKLLDVHTCRHRLTRLTDISNIEQVTERAILEWPTERPNGDADMSYKVKLVNTALHSQQDSCPSAHGPAATKGKEHRPDHWTKSVGDGEELEERTSDKESSTKRARSPSTSPEPIKRRRRHIRTCSRIESEAEDASNAYYKISRQRTRIGKKPIVDSQSATVPDGDWLIDEIVGERRGSQGREFMVQWRPTWVFARDVNAEHCKQQWRVQKRRTKTCSS